MEVRSLNILTVTGIHSAMTRTVLREKLFRSGQMNKTNNFKMYSYARKLKFLDFRPQASGPAKFNSVAVEAIPKDVNLKDENLVFVAGATGKVGSRCVRELLKLGFRVKAGVRSAQRAESLLQSVQQMKLDVDGTKPNNRTPLVFSPAIEKLEIVECDLEKPNQIGPPLGNASVIICCIGASEKEVFDVTGPYRIDYQATKNLIDAATIAKVDHFVLLTSLGTNKIGFPAAILNLFWGVLIWKRKAEKALLASGVPYTIVRPGGMERPTDAYKETHNITISQEDTLFGGQVSNLQVAELMAFMAKNRKLSYCKVVEVISETTAPLTPLGEFLATIPSQRFQVYSPMESDTVDASKPAASNSIVTETPSTPVVLEPAKAKEISTRPLSPYVVYEDLKPPTSPTPTPSTTPATPNNLDAVPAAPELTPSSSQINFSEPSNAVVEEQVPRTEVMKTRPLSPYINYDDLKPPSSPTPTPSGGQKDLTIIEAMLKAATTTDAKISTTSGTTIGTVESKSTSVEVQTSSPLSPYSAYAGLKPPSSPSPTPSGPKIHPSAPPPAEVVSQAAGGNNIPKTTTANVVEKDSALEVTFSHSPYHAYDNLKPPSSPSPSAPTVPVLSTSSLDVESQKASESENGTPLLPQANYMGSKLSPLSPFTMYEDLKPPTSPTPRKL